MDYIKALLELIKSKRELYKTETINIYFEEIAEVWNKGEIKKFYQTNKVPEDTFDFRQRTTYPLVYREFLYQVELALKRIEEDGFVSIIDRDKEKTNRNLELGVIGMYVSEDAICLKLKNGFDEYYLKKFPMMKVIKKQKAPPLPEILYNDDSCTGFVNANPFKIKDDKATCKIFSELCKDKNIKKKVPREKILSMMGFEEVESLKKNPKDKNKTAILQKDATYRINELVKGLRKKTQLDKTQLVNNNGNLTLIARRIKTID